MDLIEAANGLSFQIGFSGHNSHFGLESLSTVEGSYPVNSLLDFILVSSLLPLCNSAANFIFVQARSNLDDLDKSTLSKDLIPLTIGMDDSRSLWLSLEKRFARASRTHIHSLRAKIQMIQKGDSSMTDYLNSIKEITNKLVVVGEPISESDLVAYILFGLPDDYESFVDSIETINESVTSDELHGLLLSKEISFQKRKTRLTASNASTPFHAYAAQSSNNSGHNS
ncbi:hypothetical protein ACFX14_006240 [Malus domestica]